MEDKDPSFPFYAKDWILETKRLPFDVKGLLADLRAEAWINGPFDDIENYPSGLTTVERRLFDGCRHLWTLFEKKWFFSADETAREKRKIFRQLQSDRGHKSVEARKNQLSKKNSEKKIIQREFNHGSNPVEPVGNGKENVISLVSGKDKGTGKRKTKRPLVLFRESPYFEFTAFEMSFFGTDYEQMDLKKYYNSALNWSDSKENKKVDWIATVKGWMDRDSEISKKSQNGNQSNFSKNGTARTGTSEQRLEGVKGY